MLPAAEVAHVMLVVAEATQRRHLARRPPLTWQPIRRLAVIAEAAGDQAAVDARSQEGFPVPEGNRLHDRHGSVDEGSNGLLVPVTAGLGHLASDTQPQANQPAGNELPESPARRMANRRP